MTRCAGDGRRPLPAATARERFPRGSGPSRARMILQRLMLPPRSAPEQAARSLCGHQPVLRQARLRPARGALTNDDQKIVIAFGVCVAARDGADEVDAIGLIARHESLEAAGTAGIAFECLFLP